MCIYVIRGQIFVVAAFPRPFRRGEAAMRQSVIGDDEHNHPL
jgi:hypothetical protein